MKLPHRAGIMKPRRYVTLIEPKEDYFDIGIIVKPQGIKGEVRVLPVTDDPERFALLDEADIVFKDGTRKTYALTRSRSHQSLVILKFDGVDDRNTAEALTGGVIKIPPEKALPLDADEYYIRDLLGITVYTEQDEVLGVITDVLGTGANDVYAVKTQEGTEILIPAIKECVRNISIHDKKMRVRLMDGMIPDQPRRE